jgi:tyrosyl-tRNA synthetase
MLARGADLIADLRARELVAQMTSGDEILSHLDEPRTVYCGFDPTANSLHIGSLVPLLALRRFQLYGHKPLILVGGATGLIGDPSHKAEERQLNTPDVVADWVARLKNQVSRFVDFESGSSAAEVVNNLDWVGSMTTLDFLRDVGKHFSVNAMVHKESVRQRIERDGTGISFTEFSYLLLQSFDFSELYKNYGCTVQIGGSDQWGNITGGIDLTRRQHQAQVFGLTLPLITKTDGTKFGKTESGTIWLDAAKTSPYAFYQFWINTADEDVYRFLRFFTFLSIEELLEIERADLESQGKRSAQTILAREVTRLVHGEQGVAAAERISQALFSGELGTITEPDMEQLAQDGMPCTDLFDSELPLVDVLLNTGLALTPRGEVTVGQARKFVRDGAIRVDGVQIRDQGAMLGRAGARYGRFNILRRGKKNFHLARWV